MKYSIIGFLLLILSFLSNNVEAQEESKIERDHFTVEVQGLGCPYCAYGLERKFKDFKEIGDIEIEIETGIFTFSYPASESLSIIQVEEQVEEAGYTPVKTNIARSNGAVEESGLMQILPIEADSSSSEINPNKNSLTVAGNCSMCKSRIEQSALQQEGVNSAIWNADNQQLILEFDAKKTSLEAIGSAIAADGHDNEKAKAEASVYDELPACCQYARID